MVVRPTGQPPGPSGGTAYGGELAGVAPARRMKYPNPQQPEHPTNPSGQQPEHLGGADKSGLPVLE